jgi:beta-galactosidase
MPRHVLLPGGKVLFTPPVKMLDNTCPPLATLPIFWNRVMNNTNARLCVRGIPGPACRFQKSGPGRVPHGEFLRLAVDGHHQAMSEPSTSRTLRPSLQPVVQAIDDWNRGYKLGVIFECNVGKGQVAGQRHQSAGQLQSSVARQFATRCWTMRPVINSIPALL